MVFHTLSLNIPDKHPIFHYNGRLVLSITEIVINNQNQVVPAGTFTNPQQLKYLLHSVGWTHTPFNDGRHQYTLRLNNHQNKEIGSGGSNYITFSDLTTFNFDVSRDSRQFPISREAEAETDSVADQLLDIPCNTDTDVCQYTGLIDLSTQFSFLNDIQQKYYILTALDTVSGVVSGPIAFSNTSEYSMALAQLYIIVQDNLVTVLQTPSAINKIFFLDHNMSIIASIDLSVSLCCPDLTQGKVLFQKGGNGGEGGNGNGGEGGEGDGGEVSWLSLDCLQVGGLDLQRQICLLPLGADTKCTVQLDAAKPFLNNNPANYAFPWKVNSFVLLGENISSQFSGLTISSFQDWADILTNMNWSLLSENTSVYFFYRYINGSSIDEDSSYSLMDHNGNLFYTEDLLSDCVDLGGGGEGELEIIYKFPGQGDVVRGGVNTIFNQVPNQDGQTFSCTTTALTLCIINDLNNAGIGAPWHFSKINLSGQEQMPIGNNFSTKAQLEAVLVQMGWKKETNNVFSLTLDLEAPNSQSCFEITGQGGDKLLIDLPVLCLAHCAEDNENNLVLTKSENGHYSWSAPSCLNGGGLVVNCGLGSTGILGDVPDCDVEPRYDLKIKLKNGLIDIINSHFSSNGPYWILAYKLSGGDTEPIQKQIGEHEADVFSLQLLTQCLVEGLGWQSSVPVEDLDNGDGQGIGETIVTLYASPLLIHGICLNLLGEYGTDLPFNYVIPITDICNVTCLGLGKLEDNQVLIRGPTGFCFVDLACILPIVPPKKDLDLALCELPECGDGLEEGETGPGDFLFNTCINLDTCDVDKLRVAFGETNLIEINSYQLLNDDLIYVNHNLGTVDPDSETFLDQIIAAFINGEGWSSPDVNARPVELNKVSNHNIAYIVFNRVGANPNIAPYPCLFPANCSQVIMCPSTNPENMIMIKKPEGTVCWTPICPLAGPEGPPGENAITLSLDAGTGAGTPPTSGPIEIESDETLRVWSPGTVTTSVSGNALQINTNIFFFNGNGMTPQANSVLPGDLTQPALYYNGSDLYIWNPDSQDWDTFP